MARACEILVVEDDPSVGALVRELLGDEGYRVTVVATYEAALAALDGSAFDVVLLDSPGAPLTADHWRAMACLRDRAGATPVVLFTAHREADVNEYAARGFRSVIFKPFDVEALLAAIDAALPDDCEPESNAA